MVFVCDIENIRNIFHSKYGEAIDFSGYIDKFYSIELFNFDNKIMISNAVNDLLDSIDVVPSSSWFLNKQMSPNSINGLNFILSEFVVSGGLNLRKLKKLNKHQFNIDNDTTDRHLLFRGHDLEMFPFLIELNFLIQVCGSINDLLSALQIWGKKRPLTLNAASMQLNGLIETGKNLLTLYAFQSEEYSKIGSPGKILLSDFNLEVMMTPKIINGYGYSVTISDFYGYQGSPKKRFFHELFIDTIYLLQRNDII